MTVDNTTVAAKRIPRREEIGSHHVAVLVKGASNKADLTIVDLGDGPIVIKDFGNKPLRTRLLGRLQIYREVRAYRWLGPSPVTPTLIGRVDRWAMAMEKIDGEQLAFMKSRMENGPALIAGLRKAVDVLHRAGIFHMDLRGRENVLVNSNGEIVLIDLAAAICLRPGGLLSRILSRWVRIPDESAYLKWKKMLAPGTLTGEEQEFDRRTARWRNLWIFNRKTRVGKGTAP
jgi:serine/threonine protein kinase